jgi:hypothetical protein
MGHHLFDTCRRLQFLHHRKTEIEEAVSFEFTIVYRREMLILLRYRCDCGRVNVMMAIGLTVVFL